MKPITQVSFAFFVSLGIAGAQNRNRIVAPNPTGTAVTISTARTIDLKNPFFSCLGTNGRSCGSCHRPEDGWSITPAHLRERFDATDGLDPVFRPVDGSNSPTADVSTVDGRRAAYSMLLNKALIRVGLPIPPNAEFELIGVDDPYGFASASELSLFRRPLPSTNLRFLSAVMWDARETITPITTDADRDDDLRHQIIDATLGHAQAMTPPAPEQVEQILAFESALHTAQVLDTAAGNLSARGGRGGPGPLSTQTFFIGINDPLGDNPTGAPFDREAMHLFQQWFDIHGGSSDPGDAGDDRDRNSVRAAVARGERIFNTRTFGVSGVGGLNDKMDISTIQATCTTCHDSPNVGNHSVALALNIGLTNEARRTPDMPLYTLRNKTDGSIVKTTDPGRAMLTGRWADIGKFKGPVLRALPTRAPYFHNGMASSLDEVVEFYDTRFQIGFTSQEKSDLIAFLRTL